MGRISARPKSQHIREGHIRRGIVATITRCGPIPQGFELLAVLCLQCLVDQDIIRRFRAAWLRRPLSRSFPRALHLLGDDFLKRLVKLILSRFDCGQHHTTTTSPVR
ncbi:MAG: hypothetical protein WCW68_14370 [Methanothrix sp.]